MGSEAITTTHDNMEIAKERMKVIKPASAPFDSMPFDVMKITSLTAAAQSLYPKPSHDLITTMSHNNSKYISERWQEDIALKWLEYDPVSDGDGHLRQLIETYAAETKKAIVSQQEVEDKLKLSKKEQELVWKTVTRVTEKYGKCADGNNVKVTHTFEIKEFDKIAFEKLQSSLTDLRNSAVTNVHIHSARIARLELDSHVYGLCVNPHAVYIKNAIKQFWGYTRFGESDVVHKDVRRWISLLITAWHNTIQDPYEVLEIVELAVRSQASWTANFIQVNPSYIDLVMKSLHIITKRPENMEKRDASLDEEWLIIDNLGEIESRTEKVLLAFLDQVPVRQSIYQKLDSGSYDCEVMMACVEHVCQILENVTKEYESCGTAQERIAVLLLQLSKVIGSDCRIKQSSNFSNTYDAIILHCTEVLMSTRRLCRFSSSLPFNNISPTAAANCAFIIRKDDVTQQIERLEGPHYFLTALVNLCKQHPVQMAAAACLDVVELFVLREEETKLAITLLSELISTSPDIVLNTLLRLSLKFPTKMAKIWHYIPVEPWRNLETKLLEELLAIDKTVGQMILSKIPWRFLSSELHYWVYKILLKELFPQSWVWKVAVQLHFVQVLSLEKIEKTLHLDKMFHFITKIKEGAITESVLVDLMEIMKYLLQDGHIIAVLKCLDSLDTHKPDFPKKFSLEIIKTLLIEPEASKLIKSIIVSHIIRDPTTADWWVKIITNIADWYVIPEVMDALELLCSAIYRYSPTKVSFFDDHVNNTILEQPKGLIGSLASWFSSKTSVFDKRFFFAYFWLGAKSKLEEEKWKHLNHSESPKKILTKSGLERSVIFELAEIIIICKDHSLTPIFWSELTKYGTTGALILKTNTKLYKRLKDRLSTSGNSAIDMFKWIDNPKLNRVPEIHQNFSFADLDKLLDQTSKPWRNIVQPMYDLPPTDKPDRTTPLSRFKLHVDTEKNTIIASYSFDWSQPPIEPIPFNILTNKDALLASCRSEIGILTDAASRASGRAAKLVVVDMELLEELLPNLFYYISEKITVAKECSSILPYRSCSGAAGISFQTEITHVRDYTQKRVSDNRSDHSHLIMETVEKSSKVVCLSVTKLNAVTANLVHLIKTTVSATEREVAGSAAMELLQLISLSMSDETEIWPPTNNLFASIVGKLGESAMLAVPNGLHHIIKCILCRPKTLSPLLCSAFNVNNVPEEFSNFYDEVGEIGKAYSPESARPLLNRFDFDIWLTTTPDIKQINRIVKTIVSGIIHNPELSGIYCMHAAKLTSFGYSQAIDSFIQACSRGELKDEVWLHIDISIGYRLNCSNVLRSLESTWLRQRSSGSNLYDIWRNYMKHMAKLIMTLLRNVADKDQLFGLINGVLSPWLIADKSKSVPQQPYESDVHVRYAQLMAKTYAEAITEFDLLRCGWMTIFELTSGWTGNVRSDLLPVFENLTWENFDFEDQEMLHTLVEMPRYFLLKVINRLPLTKLATNPSLLGVILLLFNSICAENTQNRDDLFNLLVIARTWDWSKVANEDLINCLKEFKRVYSADCLLSDRTSLHYGLLELIWSVCRVQDSCNFAREYMTILAEFVGEISKEADKTSIIYANLLQKAENRPECIPNCLSALNICNPTSEKQLLNVAIDWARGGTNITTEIVDSACKGLASLESTCRIVEASAECAFEKNGHTSLDSLASFFRTPSLGEFSDVCIKNQCILVLCLMAKREEPGRFMESVTSYTRKLRDLKPENEPKVIQLWRLALLKNSMEFAPILEEIANASTPNSILVTLRLKNAAPLSQKLRLFACILASSLGKCELSDVSFASNLKNYVDFGKRLLSENNKGCIECLQELLPVFYPDSLYA
ncbi:DgyrCDS11530 [Dimorphilus gyrociliatus]|uniref:DgyrCDS11530 n=1 Tax=Dimorphilus gyrociliatus TaxID=2664684 RepID=A0A7I8W4N5_9ANNE|nr:DgyrCDS11530 [Dimorphilus gyrociliatus]